MLNVQFGYASYLLRLRRVQSNHQHIWVASLQSTTTGEQFSFANLTDLVRFLQTEFGGGDFSADGSSPDRRPDANHGFDAQKDVH